MHHLVGFCSSTSFWRLFYLRKINAIWTSIDVSIWIAWKPARVECPNLLCTKSVEFFFFDIPNIIFPRRRVPKNPGQIWFGTSWEIRLKSFLLLTHDWHWNLLWGQNLLTWILKKQDKKRELVPLNFGVREHFWEYSGQPTKQTNVSLNKSTKSSHSSTQDQAQMIILPTHWYTIWRPRYLENMLGKVEGKWKESDQQQGGRIQLHWQ